MVIGSSTVSMGSSRNYSSYSREESASLTTTSDKAAQLTFSAEGISMLEQMRELQHQANNQPNEEQRNSAQHLNILPDSNKKVKGKADPDVKSKEELKIQMLKKMIEALKKYRPGSESSFRAELKKIQSESKQAMFSSQILGNLINGETAASGGQTVWTRTTVKSSFFEEQENTAFAATGKVKTADGREIDFNISLEMSRAYCERNESLVREEVILTDPLVINVGSDIASVSDQKFLFDIDADGKKDEISYLGKGSGFLALDKNNDGRINDGSELFGAKSGDGFADLAKYDADGNGWIDEADSIFKDLKVWMKNEDGTDRLLSLKEAGVGAIYLGSASTQFSLNNMETNKTNAVIQKTGVYLKENGGVGTIQHVDLAV